MAGVSEGISINSVAAFKVPKAGALSEGVTKGFKLYRVKGQKWMCA
jgi:hypothetical protein